MSLELGMTPPFCHPRESGGPESPSIIPVTHFSVIPVYERGSRVY